VYSVVCHVQIAVTAHVAIAQTILHWKEKILQFVQIAVSIVKDVTRLSASIILDPVLPAKTGFSVVAVLTKIVFTVIFVKSHFTAIADSIG